MLKFALKNMGIKKVQIILIVISIVISASVGVLAYNIASQVDDGITENAGYYSMIIGPAGSKTQLAMNTMYFTDSPLGTIPYSVVTSLKAETGKVSQVIPFAMADNYNSSKVVGTTSAFLNGKELLDGTMFKDGEEGSVVVGYSVAKDNGLKIGDTIYTSHSASGNDKHSEGLTVVGILEESYTVYDKVVFTQIESLWHMHDHGEHTEGEHEHEHKTVCAILVSAKNPTYAMQLTNEYDGKIISHGEETFTLQAIEPMSVVRDVLDDADNTKYIVFVLCAIILIMNIMVISIITLLNMYHSKKEISLMRLIGISMKKINLLYMIQNSIIGLVSTIVAFLVSRLCLALAGDYVSTMGVVLNLTRVYPVEIVILVGIFLISVIPTIICTFVMAKQDSLAE